MAIRNEIIRLLEQNRQAPLSGQELARQLGVSRSAVWKTVQALQKEGYGIAATRNGYRLESDSDMLSAEGIRLHLGTVPVGEIRVYAQVDSTNNVAKQAAVEGVPDRSIIVADAQTAGRGRQGRDFYSPPGSGLYMSIVLRPHQSLSDSLLVTVAAAVAVCRAVEELAGLQPRIKWVNDVFLDNKKFVGILTEAISDFESGMVEAIVVGIGVNVRPVDLPPELRDVVTSLPARSCTRNALCAAVFKELLWVREYPRSQLIAAYKERSLLLGRTVCFERDGVAFEAQAVDINDDGNLVVRNDGTLMTLCSGEVSVRL